MSNTRGTGTGVVFGIALCASCVTATPSFILNAATFEATATISGAVQIFDQCNFKRRDQGFLGVVNLLVNDVLDLELGGCGVSTLVILVFLKVLTFPTPQKY